MATHAEYLIMLDVSPDCNALEVDSASTNPSDLGLNLYVKDQYATLNKMVQEEQLDEYFE